MNIALNLKHQHASVDAQLQFVDGMCVSRTLHFTLDVYSKAHHFGEPAHENEYTVILRRDDFEVDISDQVDGYDLVEDA